jgi:hypothetical protein
MQVGQGRAHAYFVRIVQRQSAYTGGLWMVHVTVFWKVCRHARPVKRHLKRIPGGTRAAAHRNRASSAMYVVLDVQVCFQFPEVGQDLAIRPCVIAQGSPAIKVFREAAEKNHVVNGTGAANHLATWRRSRSLLLVNGRVHERPVMGSVWLGCRLMAVILEFCRQVVQVRVVRARFQQQHRTPGVFREPRRQRATRRPRADHNHVVVHCQSLSPRLRRRRAASLMAALPCASAALARAQNP